MASRSLSDLDPRVQPKARAFVAACKAEGIDLLVTCTLRTPEEQAALYAQGRTTPGNIVTNAKPGSSAHNYGFALDVVPLVGGKPDWHFDPRNISPVWQRIGALGQAAGLEWFGAQGSPFVEGAHLQLQGWRSLIT